LCAWIAHESCLFLLAQIPIAQATAFVWRFFEPLLFGLVGAEVSVEYMETGLVGEIII
jgi:hypothetical protein